MTPPNDAKVKEAKTHDRALTSAEISRAMTPPIDAEDIEIDGPMLPISPVSTQMVNVRFEMTKKPIDAKAVLAEPDKRVYEDGKGNIVGWLAVSAQSKRRKDALRQQTERVEEWEQSFDLYHAAEMRGIKLWQEATGKDMEWPDAGKLTAWLLDRLDKQTERVEADRKIDGELLFQGGCTLVLMDHAVAGKKLLERAKALGHPDAAEQVEVLSAAAKATQLFICERCPGVAAMLVPGTLEEARTIVLAAGWIEQADGTWLCNNHARSDRVVT